LSSLCPIEFMSDQNLQLNTVNTSYFYKKTEKLVSAIYLLSNFISDKEPLKWKLREAGLELLSQGLSDRLEQGNSLLKTILSLLQVSYISRMISEMNYNILKYEFEALIQMVETQDKKNDIKQGIIFPEHFFDIFEGNSKGQIPMSDRFTRPIDKLSDRNNGLNIKDKVNKPILESPNRQDLIIGLLKKNNNLGIKDFVSSIKDCSEKTIQRELVSLVSKGQIKKVGEKRWSRYLLK